MVSRLSLWLSSMGRPGEVNFMGSVLSILAGLLPR